MFQSEQKDNEGGLTYLRARYYDPTLGRFTSLDPVSGAASNPASQNGYNYANNDPINLSDPTGLSAQSWLMDKTGLTAYQNDIAKGCSWGSTARDGTVASAKLAILYGGAAAAAYFGGAALAGGGAASSVPAAGSAASAPLLRNQLAMQEAVSAAGQKIGEISKMIIPKSNIKDPLYQGFEKWQYEHIGLDGVKTIVHYMYNPVTKVIEQLKVK